MVAARKRPRKLCNRRHRPPRPRGAPPELLAQELPFALVLILTTLGVAYTSFSKQPIVGFWELLAPLIALVCIGSGMADRHRQNGAADY